MEIAGLIISVLALLVPCLIYVKHDYKIKKQEFEKNEREKISEKKAIIEANIIKNIRGESHIKIYNKGKSIAKNVFVTIPKMDGYEVYNIPCPIDLKPQCGIDISLFLFIGAPDKIDIKYEWSDDFSETNNDTQTIQL